MLATDHETSLVYASPIRKFNSRSDAKNICSDDDPDHLI